MNRNQLITRADIPNLTPMFGNLGNSWNNPFPNDLFIKSIAKTIHTDFSKVDQSGAGPDTLHTFSFPANSLKVGDIISSVHGGNIAANNNNKEIRTEFDAQVIENTGGLDKDDVQGWIFLTKIGIIDTTHVICVGNLIWGPLDVDSTAAIFNTFTSGFFSGGRNRALTVADITSNAMVLRVRAGGAAAADVYQNFSEIQLTRF